MTNSSDQGAAPGNAEQSAIGSGGQVGDDRPIGPMAHTGGDGPQPVEPPGALHIQLDRQDIEVSPASLHDGELTGRQIRELATPPIGVDRDIFEIVPGGSDQKIGDDDAVAIRDHIRFFSAPRNINPGAFGLPAVSASHRHSCHERPRSVLHAAG